MKNKLKQKIINFTIKLIEGKALRSSIKIALFKITCVLNKIQKDQLIKKIDNSSKILLLPLIRLRTKIDDNKVIFVTSRGSYNCNPRAIAQELIDRGEDLKIVWVIRKEDVKKTKEFPKRMTLVVRDSYKFFKEIYSSKVIIDNSISSEYMGFRKKRNQILIQTWHGSLGIKRFETTSDKTWIRKAKNMARKTDYCISNSSFETNLFRKTFWKKSIILEYGHARNDILNNSTEEYRNIVKEFLAQQYGVPTDHHLFLYAPTYRDSMTDESYLLNYEAIKAALEQTYGGHWTIIVRLHLNVRKWIEKNKSKTDLSGAVDVSDY